MDAHATASAGNSPSRPVERRKPLRTYGKKRPQSILPDANNTTHKRRRTASIEIEAEAESQTVPKIEVPRPPVPPPSSSFEKGSILNYFKPSRAASSRDLSAFKSSCPKRTTLTPPSSPPTIKPTKTPRRLNLRPPATVQLHATEIRGEADEDAEDEDDVAGPNSGIVARKIKENGAILDSHEESLHDHERYMRDVPASALNQQPPQGTSPPAATPKHVSKAVRSKSAPVQTTINLSTKAAFEECKTCRTVYNPLHPNDVKYHAKRHKAIIRSKSRT